MKKRYSNLLVAVMVVTISAFVMACEGCSMKQNERIQELAKGQAPRTEEGLELQKRCAQGSDDPVACDGVRRTLEADQRIFDAIVNGPPK